MNYSSLKLHPISIDYVSIFRSIFILFQIIAAGGAIGNIAFSPFGLMAVSVLLYEGSSGYSALQIKQSLNLPWEILAVRVGVRDLNRYLKVNTTSSSSSTSYE